MKAICTNLLKKLMVVSLAFAATAASLSAMPGAVAPAVTPRKLMHLAALAAVNNFSPEEIRRENLPAEVRALIAEERPRFAAATAALFAAVRADDVAAARACLADTLVDAVNAEKMTPLMVAAELGREAIATFLLDRGANPNADVLGGMTPLLFAIKSVTQGQQALVSLLLRRGADANKESKIQVPDLEALGVACRVTPLLASLMSHGNNMNIVELLLKHGADAKKPVEFVTFSAQGVNMREWLLARLQGLENASNPIGMRIYMFIRHFMPDKKIAANARMFITPLFSAVTADPEANAKVFTQWLLERGADANVGCYSDLGTALETKITPLTAAAVAGNADIVSELLLAGADAKSVNTFFDPSIDAKMFLTPLFCAVLRGNARAVQYLLLAGADAAAESRLTMPSTGLDLRVNPLAGVLFGVDHRKIEEITKLLKRAIARRADGIGAAAAAAGAGEQPTSKRTERREGKGLQ